MIMRMRENEEKLSISHVLILAAGRGERLRPITYDIPKPLVEVCGIPVIVFPIFLAFSFGFRKFIVNTHWKAEMLEKFLLELGRKKGIEFALIREKELLGTGGTIKKVFEDFDVDELLVINSDVICDADLRSFFRDALRFGKELPAHLLLYKGSIGGVLVGSDEVERKKGFITVIPGEGSEFSDVWKLETSQGSRGLISLTFTGIHIVRRRILDFFPKKKPLCIVRDGYIPALSSGEKLSFSLHEGFFADIGTHERLFWAEKKISKMCHQKKLFSQVADFYFSEH